jgi:tetratricopeptide (TPR) repeat protein
MPRSKEARLAWILGLWLTACPSPGGEGGPAILPAASLPKELPGLLRIADDIEHPERALAAARRGLTLEPENPGIAWRAARACLLLADGPGNTEARMRFAKEGVTHGERAIARDPKSAEGHYYLALNLGLIAQAQNLRALGLVPRIAAEAKRALELGPALERGGPLRLLGLLYAKAPPWPTSIGDMEEALRLLRKATADFADQPLNRLFLAEALLGAERYEEAKTALKQVLAEPPTGDWARIGKRWRKHARKLLRRAEVGERQRDE